MSIKLEGSRRKMEDRIGCVILFIGALTIIIILFLLVSFLAGPVGHPDEGFLFQMAAKIQSVVSAIGTHKNIFLLAIIFTVLGAGICLKKS